MSDTDPFAGPDDPWTRTTSPDRAHVWIVKPAEWAASQWVMAGELWSTAPRAPLFVPAEDWSFENRAWTSPRTLRLEARRFPGVMPGLVLTLHVDQLAGTIVLDADTRQRATQPPAAPAGMRPFAVLVSWLAAYPTR